MAFSASFTALKQPVRRTETDPLHPICASGRVHQSWSARRLKTAAACSRVSFMARDALASGRGRSPKMEIHAVGSNVILTVVAKCYRSAGIFGQQFRQTRRSVSPFGPPSAGMTEKTTTRSLPQLGQRGLTLTAGFS